MLEPLFIIIILCHLPSLIFHPEVTLSSPQPFNPLNIPILPLSVVIPRSGVPKPEVYPPKIVGLAQ